MKTSPQDLTTVLVTDCGSTTTKALLFEKTAEGWRQTARGEAPTTVEEPVADVTVGAINAFTEVQELSGRKLLTGSANAPTPFLETSTNPREGIDLYLSTSSAGGGLQMLVAGVVREMTTESAERAALGAGAIVMDALSADDGREEHQRIERVRHLKPDIVLLTGGIDGGTRSHVVEVAELLVAAAPRPRFGDTLKLPVVYAGNKDAASEVKEILGNRYQVAIVDNVRPTLDRENLEPARSAIHEYFLSHVMSHSPGYGKLLGWSPVAVMPTPAAVGDMVMRFAENEKREVLCADIGGATTDVFSVCTDRSGERVFHRTVSANLGMSYSVANVLLETGAKNISRWLPYQLDESDLRDRLRNKMIRPTSIPQTMEDLFLEQAVCREALNLSLRHHRSLAVGLSGAQQKRGIADIFSQASNRYELLNLMRLDVVIGSGGVLSHAPHRLQAALMMLDGFALQGVTELTVDSIFMMPHLGVLASVHPQAADEIFRENCMVRVGHAIAPVYPNRDFKDKVLARVLVAGVEVGRVHVDALDVVALCKNKQLELTVEPMHRSVNCGAGPGKTVVRMITTGEVGLLLDGRNRPLTFPTDTRACAARQKKYFANLGLPQ